MQNLLPLGLLPVILQQAFLKIIDNSLQCSICIIWLGDWYNAMCWIYVRRSRCLSGTFRYIIKSFFPSTNSLEVFTTFFFFFCLNDFHRVASYFNPPNKYLFISLMYQTPAKKLEMQWWTQLCSQEVFSLGIHSYKVIK